MARERDKADSLGDLETFGEHLAKQKGYTERTGLEAIRLYLCEKYLWSAETARILKGDDLRFILADEMKGWATSAGYRPNRW